MTYVLRYGSIRDGRIYGVLPAGSASGSMGMNGDGQLNVTIPAGDYDANGNLLSEQIYRSLPPGKGMWALEWRDGPTSRRIIDAGSLWNRGIPEDEGSVTWGGAGILAMLKERLLIPTGNAAAVAAGQLYWPNFDYGSLIAQIVQQVITMPAGNLPINLQALRSGTRIATYNGYDLATAGQRIQEIIDIFPNTDMLLVPRFVTGSTTYVTWDLITGTEANPKLTNVTPWRLNKTAPGQTVVGKISVSDSATGMGTTVWAKGGGQQYGTLLANSVDTTLTDAGWPLLEQVASPSSTDSLGAQGYDASLLNPVVVQGYADGDLAKWKRPLRSVKVQVSAAWWWSRNGRVGDLVHLTAKHRVLGTLDVKSRINNVAWDKSSIWVTLTLADTLAEDGF